MRCAVLEGKIGNKAIVDVPLLFADDLAKFERQCCGNGYRARDGLIIMYYLGHQTHEKSMNSFDIVMRNYEASSKEFVGDSIQRKRVLGQPQTDAEREI